jgi:hypothetical protein
MRIFAISMVAMGVSSILFCLIVTTAVLAPVHQHAPEHAAVAQWKTTMEKN